MPNLPTWAQQYAGIEFKEKGRGRTEGLDCWGLILLVMRERFGVDLPTYDGLYETTRIKETSRLFAAGLPNWKPIRPKPGAVILFRSLGKPGHVGLVVTAPDDRTYDPGYMLHIEEGIDSCFERYTNSEWKQRTIGVYEYEIQTRNVMAA